ncbi:ROK family protein [Tropicimonas marinistellae]|uniref:ROK family protein n=1 Tax=Tropicimonas marinistellae TaxID=1739787 RepID=UPI00082CA7D1|nr:ROK family protein [Tropicimonas marinistellae]
MTARPVPLCGAIDLGGTKIEARLFGPGMETLELRRRPTPISDFDSFVAGLSEQISWLMDSAGNPGLPVGIGIPGLIDKATGECFASNVPVSGRRLGAALAEVFGRDFPIANDCMALALSETNGGAGDGFEQVIGLVLGTGVGAGLCFNGRIPERLSGLVLEIGHVGMPARVLEKYGLPLWPCGCGNTGCMERYMAGSGFERLSEFLIGTRLDGRETVSRATTGDADAQLIYDAWIDLAAECLLTLQLTLDADCIVLGGGASQIPGLLERLDTALASRQLGTLKPPALRIAQHGDSSGARGMGLMALKSVR